MTDGSSFQGGSTARGRRDLPVVLVVVLVLAGIALAIIKPWGGTNRPAASTQPDVAAASPSAASATAPSAAPPTNRAQQLPVAFTAPAPQAASAWVSLTWHRLAPDDPLGAVLTEVTAGGTSIAIGDIPGTTSTTVWSSTDATHWEPIEDNTPTTFWPNLSIIGLAAVPSGFVAVSEMNDYLMRNLPPVVAWASSDGRSWTPAEALPLDPDSIPANSATLVAAGPNGLVVATSGPAGRLATSSDGSDWVVLPRNALPAGFALDGLEGSASGYVAIGSWMKGAGPSRAAALWSADGRHWPKAPTLLPSLTSGSGTPAFSNALTLTVGDQGMIATGIGGSQAGALWWRSADGQHWRALQGFPPIGVTKCGGASCGLQPNGTLFGDGHRLVALRTGADGVGWVSSDGERWAALSFSGDVPDAQATQATLLPGGVLVSDGTTTWFGQAEGH